MTLQPVPSTPSVDWVSRPGLRIGDVERDQVCASLADHFTAGRLSVEEFEERAGLAAEARTHGDLRRLIADLPAAPAAGPVAALAQAHNRGAQPPSSGATATDVLIGLFGGLAAICLTLLMLVTLGAGGEGPYAVIAFLAALGGTAVGVATTHFIHRHLRRRS